MSKTPKYIIKDLKPSEKEDLNRFGTITDINIWNLFYFNWISIKA